MPSSNVWQAWDMEFKEIPFTELLSKIIDNRGRSCPTAETGLPLIATNCIRNDILYPAFEKVRYVSTSTYESWFRGHPEPGDLIFVCKGTPGRVCMTPGPVSFCIAQDMVAVRADPRKVYPKYLFAVLRSSQVQEQISNMHVGTLIPHFKKGDFDKLLLPIPDNQSQEIIGDTYFELSAKIELNRRMNATLEAMARTLFHSWFVDFDPVRAKLDGREPVGLDSAIAALFPHSFQVSEVGHIPQGWRLGRLSDLCNLKRGHDLPASNRTPGPIPVISSSGISGSHSETHIRGPGVVTGRYGTIGKVFYVETDYWPLNTTLYVDDVKGNPPRFIFHVLGEVNFQKYIDKAAVPGVNRNHLHAEPMVLPPMELRQAFANTVSPLWALHTANEMESCNLANLRDTLLPKLLSGELHINE
ncbi:MAG: restriction endonuclease subunit S [Cyanobium sp. ELA712]